MKLIFFAQARDLVGLRETQLEKNDLGLNKPSLYTGESLLGDLLKKYPKLESIKSSLILAINESYIDMAAPLDIDQDDTIAIIPPTSGG